MKNWYNIHEQSAGNLRLELLWWVYKIFGIKFLKVVLWFVCLFIVPFAKPARTASKKYRKIFDFSCSCDIVLPYRFPVESFAVFMQEHFNQIMERG